MGNMTELRDHSQPCEHVGDGAYYSNLAGCWLCDFMMGEFSETLCPGGKKVHFEKLIIPNNGLFTSYIQGGSDEKNRIEVSSGHVYLIVDAGFVWIEED